jgi:hypothetical protein
MQDAGEKKRREQRFKSKKQQQKRVGVSPSLLLVNFFERQMNNPS